MLTRNMVLIAVRDEDSRQHVLDRHFVSIETARDWAQDWSNNYYSNSVFNKKAISPKELFAALEVIASRISKKDLEELDEERELIKFFKSKCCGTKVSWHPSEDQECNFVKVVFKKVTDEVWDEEELRVRHLTKVKMSTVHPVPFPDDNK